MELMHIKVLTLFLEGVLSFFSPCVLPIIPLYLSILGGQATSDTRYNRQQLINVILFIVGISATFFVLASTSSLLSVFFNQHRLMLKLISGLLIILMGLFQLGIFKSNHLSSEYSVRHKLFRSQRKVSPWLSFLMGFTFSFSWTPCVGPILASVFFYSSSQEWHMSYLLIAIYCLGFILPFVLIAIFSYQLMNYLKQKSHYLQYTSKLSGWVLIVIGIFVLSELIKL